MTEETSKKSYGYGKRPMWQWALIYIVIGGIVYGLIYYLVLAKKGDSYNNNNSTGDYSSESGTP